MRGENEFRDKDESKDKQLLSSKRERERVLGGT